MSECIDNLYAHLLTGRSVYKAGLELVIFDDHTDECDWLIKQYKDMNYGVLFEKYDGCITIRPDPSVWNVRRIRQLLDNEERYKNVIAALADNDYEYVAEAIAKHNETKATKDVERIEKLIKEKL